MMKIVFEPATHPTTLQGHLITFVYKLNRLYLQYLLLVPIAYTTLDI